MNRDEVAAKQLAVSRSFRAASCVAVTLAPLPSIDASPSKNITETTGPAGSLTGPWIPRHKLRSFARENWYRC